MSLDLGKTFGTDKKKESEGVWHEVGRGAKILVARMGNDNYAREFRQIPSGVRRQIQNGVFDDKDVEDIICRLLADTILLGWEGIGDGGKALKYTKGNAFNTLKSYPDFRQLVWDLSEEVGNYRIASLEDDVKNSETSSDGC